MTTEQLEVTPQLTPNPMSARFQLNRQLVAGPGYDFPNAEAAQESPLAARLFKLEQVKGVYLGTDFVTVTVVPGHNPLSIAEFVDQAIREHFGTGEPAYVPSGEGDGNEHAAKAGSELERQIMEVLDLKVRPAVADDGGDVIFAGYENGVVKLELRGACSGCPSSLMTLKVGIENLLREEFPEDITAVEPV